MQAKLLTVIEKREVIRLGSTKRVPIDVRLISATNADIHEMTERGEFRRDLLYRINTIELHIPPLRERGNDILLLADFFREKYNRKYKKEIRSLATSAQRKLQEYPWPGNVRELQHAMERAVILSSGYMLYADDILLTPVAMGRNSESLNLEELERKAIDQAMKQSGGNMNRAADLLGISSFTLYRKIGKQSDK